MTATLDAATARIFAACHDSPVEFARHFLALSPTAQQIEFLDGIARPGARVAVRSGHGTGKSTALAIAALWFLSTRSDALIPCTAPTAHQLQDVLWREIKRLIARMPEPVRPLYSVSQDRVILNGSAGMIVARTARPENPDALQGFHAAEILFIIDEAAGVCDAVFEVARGALSTPAARVAMAANPTRLSGYFFNAFHKARDLWGRLQFSCLDSPLVAENYAREVAVEYGDDSDMYRIRVLGDFPQHGLLSIISAERVQLAIERTLPLDAARNAPAILGVDPAWMGSDRSVVALRQGIAARVLHVARSIDGVTLATLVAQCQDKHDVRATFIDQTGVGASVCDQLRNIGRSFVPIAFGGKPVDASRFVNRRAEMWWTMREWFEQDVGLADHADIKDDLTGPEYCINPAGKIQLESKDSMRERGLASPDIGDALALTFAAKPGSGSSLTMNTLTQTYNPYAMLQRRN